MTMPTILPPGISPPLTQNNSHNHNALIVIIASLSLFLALASLAIRTYAISRRGATLKDDYVLLTIVVWPDHDVLDTLLGDNPAYLLL